MLQESPHSHNRYAYLPPVDAPYPLRPEEEPLPDVAPSPPAPQQLELDLRYQSYPYRVAS